MFNLFELYCCVKWHGGFQQVYSRDIWHCIAYDLCRVTKRKKDATLAVKECYLRCLAPFLEELCKVNWKPFASKATRRGDGRGAKKDDNNRSDVCGDVAVWSPKRPKLRSSTQRAKRPLVRRFKKQTSFDLLATVPLPLPSSGKHEIVKCIAPGQLRRTPAALPAVAQVEIVDSVPGAEARCWNAIWRLFCLGDPWLSAVKWLHAFAKCPLEKEDALEERCRFRYSSQLLRMRKKLSHSLKKQTTRSIIKQDSNDHSVTPIEEYDDEEDEDTNANIIMEGPQHQAEVPEWRPLPQKPVTSKWDTVAIPIDRRQRHR